MRASNSSGLIRFRFAIVLLSEHTKDVKAESLGCPKAPGTTCQPRTSQPGAAAPARGVESAGWILGEHVPLDQVSRVAVRQILEVPARDVRRLGLAPFLGDLNESRISGRRSSSFRAPAREGPSAPATGRCAVLESRGECSLAPSVYCRRSVRGQLGRSRRCRSRPTTLGRYGRQSVCGSGRRTARTDRQPATRASGFPSRRAFATFPSGVS